MNEQNLEHDASLTTANSPGDMVGEKGGRYSSNDLVRRARWLADSSLMEIDPTEYGRCVKAMTAIVLDDGLSPSARIKGFRVLLELKSMNLKVAEMLLKSVEVEGKIENPEAFNPRPVINVTIGPGATLDDVARLVEEGSHNG